MKKVRLMSVLVLVTALGINMIACKNTSNEKNDNISSEISTNLQDSNIETTISASTENTSTDIMESTEFESTTIHIETSSTEETIVLESKEETTTQEKIEYTVTKLDKTMYAKSTVNVRKGPSTDFGKVGSLTTGKQVKVVGKSDQTGWYLIQFDGKEGYVSDSYLQDKPVETTTKQTTTEYEEETTKISMREREKTESPYYYKKDTVDIVYKSYRHLDIKNTVLGEAFDDDDDLYFVYGIAELVETVLKYSNSYCPPIGMYDLRSTSYAVAYPYYDVRDYAFWSYTYNKDGSSKDIIWFYFDENYNVVYGEHPWWQYKGGGTLLPIDEANPEEITDNNPYHYKKDVVEFCYYKDGYSDIYNTILGYEAKDEQVKQFIYNIREVKDILENLEGEIGSTVYRKSCGWYFDCGYVDGGKCYYDIRDYEIYIWSETSNARYFYWDEKFNFVEKKE